MCATPTINSSNFSPCCSLSCTPKVIKQPLLTTTTSSEVWNLWILTRHTPYPATSHLSLTLWQKWPHMFDEVRRKLMQTPSNVCTKKCFVLFLTEEAYSHGGLRTRELGQTTLAPKSDSIIKGICTYLVYSLNPHTLDHNIYCIQCSVQTCPGSVHHHHWLLLMWDSGVFIE